MLIQYGKDCLFHILTLRMVGKFFHAFGLSAAFFQNQLGKNSFKNTLHVSVLNGLDATQG